MNDCKNRHICLSDLTPYFRKDDYFSSYSDAELEQILKNLGFTTKEQVEELLAVTNILEGTYDEIKTLVSLSELLPGHIYIITDYQTIYQSNILNDINISESQYSPIYLIALLAISNNQFSSHATILGESLDVIYDFNLEALEDGTLTKGRIVKMTDNNGNSAWYDFKNIKFRRTKEELALIGIEIEEDYQDFYTFNSNKVVNNILSKDSYNNVFFGNSCQNNTFTSFNNNTFNCSISENDLSGNNNMSKDNIINTHGNLNSINLIDKNLTSSKTYKVLHLLNNKCYLSYVDSETLSQQIIQL